VAIAAAVAAAMIILRMWRCPLLSGVLWACPQPNVNRPPSLRNKRRYELFRHG
jgi:hypothetical protein